MKLPMLLCELFDRAGIPMPVLDAEMAAEMAAEMEPNHEPEAYREPD